MIGTKLASNIYTLSLQIDIRIISPYFTEIRSTPILQLATLVEAVLRAYRHVSRTGKGKGALAECFDASHLMLAEGPSFSPSYLCCRSSHFSSMLWAICFVEVARGLNHLCRMVGVSLLTCHILG